MSHVRGCCCAPCLLCGASDTPSTWEVEFSGVTASGCQGDPDGGAPDALGGCYKFLSQEATYTIPATVCLRQLAPTAEGCFWCGTIDCTVNLYDDEACAGDLLCTSTEKIYVELRIFLDGASTKMTLFAATLSDNAYCRRGGFFSNNSFPLVLFSDTIVIGADACEDVQVLTNEVVAPAITNIGYGGTATVTPAVCVPPDDCELGDEADLCPSLEALDDCDDPITVVISGCDLATRDGTYTCARSGALWTGTNGSHVIEVFCGGGAGPGFPGIWGIWFTDAGDFPTFIALDHAACPEDVVTWEPCFGACDSATVS